MMHRSGIPSRRVESLFCACLLCAPAPLYSTPRPAAAAVAKDEHAPEELRLIDFVSRRNKTGEDRMPGEGTPVPASPGYDGDRFAAPRQMPAGPGVDGRGDAVEEARELRQEGRDGDALLLLNYLIAGNDDFMEAYLERAKIYLSKGMYDLAAGDFGEAISCRASSVEAHYNLGIALEKWAERLEAGGDGARASEKFREAIREYKKSLWYDPAYAPAYYGLGCVCSRMGMRDDARHYFQRAIESAKRDSDVARRARYNLLLLGGH